MIRCKFSLQVPSMGITHYLSIYYDKQAISKYILFTDHYLKNMESFTKIYIFFFNNCYFLFYIYKSMSVVVAEH